MVLSHIALLQRQTGTNERTLLFIDAIHIDDDFWYGRTGVLYQALVAVNGQKYVLVIVIET